MNVFSLRTRTISLKCSKITLGFLDSWWAHMSLEQLFIRSWCHNTLRLSFNSFSSLLEISRLLLLYLCDLHQRPHHFLVVGCNSSLRIFSWRIYLLCRISRWGSSFCPSLRHSASWIHAHFWLRCVWAWCLRTNSIVTSLFCVWSLESKRVCVSVLDRSTSRFVLRTDSWCLRPTSWFFERAHWREIWLGGLVSLEDSLLWYIRML